MQRTLRELAEQCDDVEFIARRGRYVLVRLPNGLGGEVRLVNRKQLEHWADEDDFIQQMQEDL